MLLVWKLCYILIYKSYTYIYISCNSAKNSNIMNLNFITDISNYWFILIVNGKIKININVCYVLAFVIQYQNNEKKFTHFEYLAFCT